MSTKKKILLVDDDENLLEGLRQRFRRLPYEIVTASGGEAAIALIHEEEFAAAVVDISMPRIDGFALVQALRRVEPDLPVLMISGLGHKDVFFQSMLAGSDGFLEKPFDALTLSKTLTSMMDDPDEQDE